MAFSIDVQNATLNLIEKCRQLQENVFLYIAGLAIHPTGVKPLQVAFLREIHTSHFHFILPTSCFQLRLPHRREAATGIFSMRNSYFMLPKP